MICDPCKEPHDAADCIDTLARRTGVMRACYCQHKPRREQAHPPTASLDGARPVDPAPATTGGTQ